MRLPLGLVNLALRVGVRGPLSRIATPQDLRHRFERDAKLLLRPERGARFEEITLPGGAGPIRALWAEAGAPREDRVILYLHGGAYLVGSPQTHRAIAAALAKEAGARALLPDYRLAPEHPFPAAVEDALSAYRWLLGRYPAHRIALAGESAGGGLSFATLLAAQAEGLAMPAAAVAFSPFADMTLSGESYRRNARREVMLPSERAEEAVGYYLQGANPTDPLASPAHGTFESPPPSLIFASDAEILCDDATMLADALRQAGGEVRVEIWPGLPHAWPILHGKLAAADRALAVAGAFISGHLG